MPDIFSRVGLKLCAFGSNRCYAAKGYVLLFRDKITVASSSPMQGGLVHDVMRWRSTFFM